MKIKWRVVLLVLLLTPVTGLANELCGDADTTLERADCLASAFQEADAQLSTYLKAARERHAYDPEVVRLIDTSQAAWEQYRGSHCDAVYQQWSGGSIRLIYHPYCLLYTTKSRTHDVWREFLTYQDSTDPVLPEPDLILYRE